MNTVSLYKLVRGNIAIILLLFYFAIKCLYLSWGIKQGLLPDEIAHQKIIDAYIEHNHFILDAEVFKPSPAGSISQDRFLYHLLVGWCGKILGYDSGNYFFFRCISIALSIITLLLGWRIGIYLNLSKLELFASLAIISNISMFTIVSCTIGYDALTILLSTYLIFQLLIFYKEESLESILKFLIVFFVGSLVKPSIYPFAPIASLLLLKPIFSNTWKDFKRRLVDDFQENLPRILLLLLVVGMFSLVQIRNYRNFDRVLTLDCYDIYGVDRCNEENQAIKFYEDMRIRNQDNNRMSFVSYLDHWVDMILQKTFGVAAHRKMLLNSIEFLLLKFTLFLALISLALTLRNQSFRLLLLIFLFYFLVVLFYANYAIYLVYGAPNASVQGRYLFPVIVPFAFLFVRSYHLSLEEFRINRFLLLLVVIFFCFLDLPSFLLDENFTQFITPDVTT